MASNQFYIYRWIRLDTNTPFYVGKGKGNRFKQDYKGSRNDYFLNIVNLVPTEVEIIMDNLTQAEAFAKEIEFIKLYKDLGYCEANLTDGGEGVSGLNCSEERKLKLSLDRKGKHFSPATEFKKGHITAKGPEHPCFGKPAHNRGIPQSDAAKKKNSESNKGKQAGSKNANFGKTGSSHPAFGRIVTEEQKNYKAVIGYNLLTDETVEFKSIKEAATVIKAKSSGINHVLSGKQKSTRNWSFKYLTNQEIKEAA